MQYVNSLEQLYLVKGVQQGALKQAIEMIRDFNLPIAKVAEKYNLPMDEIVRRLNQEDTSNP